MVGTGWQQRTGRVGDIIESRIIGQLNGPTMGRWEYGVGVTTQWGLQVRNVSL